MDPAPVRRALACAAALVSSALAVPPLSAQEVVSESSSAPYPGVEIREGRVRLSDGCFSDYYVASAALCTEYLHVDARAPATSTRTTGSWGDARGVQVAVNGDFYRYESPSWFVYGDAVGNGTRWPRASTGNGHAGWWQHNYGWIAFGPGWVEYSHTQYIKNNAAAFGATGGFSPEAFTEDIPEGTESLVSGFSEIVIEGTPYACPDATGACFPDRSDMRDRHPRTAMGLSEDRRTFYLLVVDGRQGCSSSAGMFGAELAWLAHEIGAWQAFNLDGGGSSAMWVRGRGYVNTPSDGSPRAVLNHWGIFAGEASGTAMEPGSCCAAEECNGTDDDCDGAIDERDACPVETDAGPGDVDAGPGADAGSDPTRDASAPADAAPVPPLLDAGPGEDAMSGGCGCDTVARTPPPWPLALALVVVALRRARRR
jgi:MYXO-CTERM domain-containing protein